MCFFLVHSLKQCGMLWLSVLVNQVYSRIVIIAKITDFSAMIFFPRAKVKINGFGVFMLFLYPGAYVDMHSETLFSTGPWEQLKIFCAGVWHNLVISTTSLVMLLSLPRLMLPFYSVHEHVVVVSHTPVCAYTRLSLHLMMLSCTAVSNAYYSAKMLKMLLLVFAKAAVSFDIKCNSFSCCTVYR